MTSRRVTILALLTVLAACSPPSTATTVETSEATSSTTPVPVPSAELAYGYAPGQSLRYEVMVTQDIAFTATGDAPGFGDASLPIDADLVTESVGNTTYTIGSGTAAGTFALEIAARFPETRVAGTVNGDTVDSLEEGGVEADLARIEPVDLTVMVNDLGRILDETDDTTAVLGAGLAALTGLTNDLFAVPVGPTFAPGSLVTLGDRWAIDSTHGGGNRPVGARSESEVVDIVDGVFVIETRTVTDAYAVDFSAEFRELYLELAELEEGEDIDPAVRERLDAIEFAITVDEATTVEVAHFDPERGLVDSSTKTATMRLRMVFRAPDDTGAVSGFDITLDLAQTAAFTGAP